MRFNIYKYELPLNKWRHEITIPVGSKILSANNQHGKLCIWAQVPQNADRAVEFELCVFNTGSGLADDVERFTFVDTVLFEDGALVVHVYARAKD